MTEGTQPVRVVVGNSNKFYARGLHRSGLESTQVKVGRITYVPTQPYEPPYEEPVIHGNPKHPDIEISQWHRNGSPVPRTFEAAWADHDAARAKERLPPLPLSGDADDAPKPARRLLRQMMRVS